MDFTKSATDYYLMEEMRNPTGEERVFLERLHEISGKKTIPGKQVGAIYFVFKEEV
jgi:hypothetical protein